MIRLALLVAALCMPAVSTAQNGSADRPVSGSFSAEQAARGEKVFQNSCAACHERSFHTGEKFMFSWKGRTLFDYFKLVKATMPEDNPAGLPDDDYVRVIAYIMQLNGYTAGSDSLRSDSLHLKRIRIGESREPQRAGSP